MLNARRTRVSRAIFLGVFAGLSLAGRADAADRVGSETCKSCHAAAYETWQASAHAKAANSLSPAQQQDARCAHCHAPDLARAAQEITPTAATASEGSAAHAEVGVTCEACHGAGQYYTPSYVMRDAELARAVGLVDPGQKSCLVCHTSDAPSLTPFDFAAKVKLIDHWSQTGLKKSEKRPRAEVAPTPESQGLAQSSTR